MKATKEQELLAIFRHQRDAGQESILAWARAIEGLFGRRRRARKAARRARQPKVRR